MGRRKVEHEKEANHERWLVSYADFITLLFAVFVTLYAMSQVDKVKVAKMIASTNEAFGVAKSSSAPAFNVIESEPSTLVPIKDPLRQNSTAPESAKESKQRLKQKPTKKDLIEEDFKLPAFVRVQEGNGKQQESKDTEKYRQQSPGITGEKGRADTQDFKKIKEDITTFLQEKGAEDKIKMAIGPRGLVISLKDTEFFDSGKATVRPESMYLLKNISEAIGKYSNSIRIEGHTDNIPIGTSLFPSNWELSTARATNIVRYLIATHALPPERLSAIGYGEYRPVADNSTEEGRQKNRRVDVVVLSTAAEQGEPTTKPQPKQ